VCVFLGLGSNVGNRVNYILKALKGLKSFCEIVKISTVYESQPWGVGNQPNFLNCVVEVRTDHNPFQFLDKLKKLEKEIGRRYTYRWGPREIDIDILLWKNKVLELPFLQIPHPYLEERDFFLIPLIELNEKLINPKTGIALRKVAEKNSNSLKPYCCILL